MFNKEIIEEIKSRIDYFEWYRQYLPNLQMRGKSAWTPCCWHSDSNPSLQVNIDNGIFRCWSCGKSGDIFSFYQHFFNVDFKEALEDIAKQVNVELIIDPEEQARIDKINNYFKANDIVCSWFEKELTNNVDAWNYLTQIRGISPKVIKQFKLGVGIKNLQNILKTESKKEALHKIGLLKNGENGYYSTFSDYRITIPRINERGKIGSFTGRDFKDKEGVPKYLHTTDSEIYSKQDFIFGLYQAKKFIKEIKSVICVEGEMDAIMCHQKGFSNTIALSGLNMFDQQVNKIKKYTDKFYVCIEDLAGIKALEKLYSDIKRNIPYAKVYIVDLRNEDGSKCDADMFLRSHKREEFKELIQHAKIYNEFMINQFLKDVNPKNIEEKNACIKKLIPMLCSIPNFMDRKQYIELVANKMFVPENDIYKQIKFYNQNKEKEYTGSLTWEERPVYAQKILLSICFCPNFNSLKVTQMIKINAEEKLCGIYKTIFKEYLEPYIRNKYCNGKVDFSELFTSFTEENNPIKEIIIDTYLKAEMLEDFEESDYVELIDEQIESLEDYVVTEGSLESELLAIAI